MINEIQTGYCNKHITIKLKLNDGSSHTFTYITNNERDLHLNISDFIECLLDKSENYHLEISDDGGIQLNNVQIKFYDRISTKEFTLTNDDLEKVITIFSFLVKVILRRLDYYVMTA